MNERNLLKIELPFANTMVKILNSLLDEANSVYRGKMRIESALVLDNWGAREAVAETTNKFTESKLYVEIYFRNILEIKTENVFGHKGQRYVWNHISTALDWQEHKDLIIERLDREILTYLTKGILNMQDISLETFLFGRAPESLNCISWKTMVDTKIEKPKNN